MSTLLFSLVYGPSSGSSIGVFMIGLEKRTWYRRKGDVGCKEPGKIKGNVSVRIGSSRIGDFLFIMPPSFPMVSLVCNYVRVVHMQNIGRG